MKLEVLVSTMNQKDFNLINKMNLSTDTLIINQCNKNDFKQIDYINFKVRMASYNEVGLSKSRNRAIELAEGDICLIADDDLIYNSDMERIILEQYRLNPDADIIAFNVTSTNKNRLKSTLKRRQNLGFLSSLKISSYQITFKKSSIISNNISFNELFGAGSKYTMGEENIFLYSCLRHGLKLLYVPLEIGVISHENSTWFKGYSSKYFYDRGATYREMGKSFYLIFILQFLIRKYPLYRQETTFFTALKYCLKGSIEYKEFLERKEVQNG